MFVCSTQLILAMTILIRVQLSRLSRSNIAKREKTFFRALFIPILITFSQLSISSTKFTPKTEKMQEHALRFL